MELINNCWNSI